MTKPKPWVSKDGVWTNAKPVVDGTYAYASDLYPAPVIVPLGVKSGWVRAEIRTVLPITPPPLPDDLPWNRSVKP